MQIAVRPAVPTDADPIAHVNIRSWRHAYAGIVPADYLAAMDVELYAAIWAARIADPAASAGVLAAEADGRVAGYVVVGPCRPQQDRPGEAVVGIGEVLAIYVDPPHLGAGVGRILHDAGIGWLADAGFREVTAWVLAANETSLRWYRRQGWTADGATSWWTGARTPLLEIRLRHRAG